MKSRPPKRYEEIKRRHPGVLRAYEAYGEALAGAGPLRERERALVRLGVAVGARLESAVKAHARRGRDAGLSEDALRHAAILSGTTIGFPSMMAALAWVEEGLSGKRRR